MAVFAAPFHPIQLADVAPPEAEPSRLRMRIISRPRVVVPAIQSAPVATHSVATIAHLHAATLISSVDWGLLILSLVHTIVIT